MDLIDRQAAVDALGDKPLAWTEGEYELGLQNQWQSDVDALKALPSAQPDLTLESAIDYLHSIGWMQNHDKEITDSAYREGHTAAESKYRAMWDEMQANIKEELLPDGTLHLFTDTELSKVDRVWVSQNGTHFGDLYYADGEPKIGKWVRHYSRPNVYADLCWHCSNCGYKTPDNWANKWKFCPNCGARMVQEGEDNDG